MFLSPPNTIIRTFANRVLSFASFFNHIDHFPQDEFLYITSAGIAAATTFPERGAKGDSTASGQKSQKEALKQIEIESEDERGAEEEG
jgi:tRNA pseudouridine38-40 synthase